MPEHQNIKQSRGTQSSSQRQISPAKKVHASNSTAIIQRARIDPKSLTSADVLQLQRTIGNRAVGRLLSGVRNFSTVQQVPVQRQEVPEEEEPLPGKMIGTTQLQEISEEEEPPQGKLIEPIQRREISEDEGPLQMKKENNTGMPDNLKAGVEHLSGIDMSDVRVHYKSSKPAEVGALAYTQGINIHIAPGQERHLPHEAWHVVQQAQGRVPPTMQLKGLAVNDDKVLEKEADVMEEKYLKTINKDDPSQLFRLSSSVLPTLSSLCLDSKNSESIVQGFFKEGTEGYNLPWMTNIMTKWEGAALLIIYEIIATVGEDKWKEFLTRLDSEAEYELKDEFDKKIINILLRKIEERENSEPETVPFTVPSQLPQVQSAPISVSTHNLEKFGKRTANRQEKAQLEMDLLLRTSPDIGVTQEVTRPDLLEEAVQTDPQFTEQFKFLPGPHYQSGTYQESYTAFFNRGTVHFSPTLFVIDPATGQVIPYSQPLSFGKQAAKEREKPDLEQARPTSFWEFHLPASRYNLRPPFKYMDSYQEAKKYVISHRNLRHRRNAPYFRLRHLNVHTSPSISTICKQVDVIMTDLRRLHEDEANTMASGDFYMEHGARRTWIKLNRGYDTFRVVHSGVPTNFKRGKSLQIADHSLMPTEWLYTAARAFPPGEGQSLEEWEKFGIDHAFVLCRAIVPVPRDIKTSLDLYLQMFFRGIYMQNNCLIHAIATASQIDPNQKIKTIRDLLQEKGVPIGNFIEANDENIEIIMKELGLYGVVQINNVENPELATPPIFVENYQGGTNVDITINYSRSHFYSAPVPNSSEGSIPKVQKI
jgi:hypothetical protein